MSTKSKKHHYVPQSLLRFFSIHGERKQIHIFDKPSGRYYKSSITNAGSENNYNEIQNHIGTINFESIFDEVDSRLGKLLLQIHNQRDISLLSDKDRLDWADMIAVQLLRTPIFRSTFKHLAHDLAHEIKARFGEDAANHLKIPSENDVRATSINMFLEREEMRDALYSKDFVLYQASGSKRFIISDHPVIKQASVPYGDVGLKSPGIVIYMPIGSDLMLALLCKSIQLKLNSMPLELLPAIDMEAKRLKQLKQAFLDGKPIQADDDFVLAHNHFQVANSSRFIYASENDFGEIKITLERNPNLKTIKSNIKIGKMGEGPGLSKSMPEGQWLILFGSQNHFMLPLLDYTEDIVPLEVTLQNLDLLNKALQDAPFREMRIYVDKQERRMMRNIEVIPVKNALPGRIQIRHSDSDLDKLLTRKIK